MWVGKFNPLNMCGVKVLCSGPGLKIAYTQLCQIEYVLLWRYVDGVYHYVILTTFPVKITDDRRENIKWIKQWDPGPTETVKFT